MRVRTWWAIDAQLKMNVRVLTSAFKDPQVTGPGQGGDLEPQIWLGGYPAAAADRVLKTELWLKSLPKTSRPAHIIALTH